MTAEVIELGPNENMTAEQALLYTAREKPAETLILSYDENGELYIRSSSMNNKDALWILEQAKILLLGLDD